MPRQLLWYVNSRDVTLVSVYRNGSHVNVNVHPAHIYQQYVYVTTSADGLESVMVRQWQVDMDAPSAPATTWGLRDIDDIGRHYRVEFEYFSVDGQRLTVTSGPHGYLVRLIIRHPLTKIRESNGSD